VSISRASYVVNFPANFVLLAAMNPCPCGFHGHPNRKCSCTPQAIRLYRSKISGPLLDRIDLQISVPPADLKSPPAEDSATVRKRVITARNMQLDRAGVCNALMSNEQLRRYCVLDKLALEVLNQAMVQHKLSARAYERILKMARTVADLSGSTQINLTHLAEAIGYRA